MLDGILVGFGIYVESWQSAWTLSNVTHLFGWKSLQFGFILEFMVQSTCVKNGLCD